MNRIECSVLKEINGVKNIKIEIYMNDIPIRTRYLKIVNKNHIRGILYDLRNKYKVERKNVFYDGECYYGEEV